MYFVQKLKNRKKYRFDDFTEAKYRYYLKKAKARFRFITYAQVGNEQNVCLWRHDIDTSPHRALKLAEIEYEEGVVSNYFIHLHSERYSALEPEVVEIFKKISSYGHNVGLHFDLLFLSEKIQCKEDLIHYLRLEKVILEEFLDIEVNSFSFHNPSLYENFNFNMDTIDGLVNTYGKSLEENFEYLSDSFGYWRFRSLDEVLSDDSVKNLHVLLHPAFWSEKPSSPYQRFLHTVNGRRNKVHEMYFDFKKKHNLDVIR